MMSLSPWNKYWFTPSPYFDLAIVRVLAVAFQLYILLSYFGGVLGALQLPDSIYLPLPALKIFMLPWGWGARPDEAMVLTIFWSTIVAGILALIGLLTNVSLFCFAMGCIFLKAFEYSFGEQHHPEAIMMVALVVFSFSPCGKVLSVDSFLKKLRKRATSEVQLLQYKGEYAGWPIKLMQCFFALMYISAIQSKLTHGGLDWVNGFTLQYYLVQDGIRGDSPLALWVSQFHYPVYFLQIFVLSFQATFFLIIFFPKLRWIYLPIGLVFHIGIYLTLKAPFPQWIVLYALFVPWAQGLKWLNSYPVAADLRSGDRSGI